jgi:hypothetical protein
MRGRYGLVVATSVLLLTACGRSERFEPIATGAEGTTEVTVGVPDGEFERGTNVIRVEFHGPGHQPVDVGGAAITLRAPAVGAMAAQTRDVSLARRGVGIYEGRVALNRTGPWQGTVQWQEDGIPKEWTFSTSSP